MKLLKVFICILSCMWFLFADDPASPKEEKTAKEKKSPGHVIHGIFVSSNALANIIVVKVGKKEDTLSVDTTAKVIMGMDTIQMGGIVSDSKLALFCKMVDGKKVVEKIKVMVPKAEKSK